MYMYSYILAYISENQKEHTLTRLLTLEYFTICMHNLQIYKALYTKRHALKFLSQTTLETTGDHKARPTTMCSYITNTNTHAQACTQNTFWRTHIMFRPAGWPMSGCPDKLTATLAAFHHKCVSPPLQVRSTQNAKRKFESKKFTLSIFRCSGVVFWYFQKGSKSQGQGKQVLRKC